MNLKCGLVFIIVIGSICCDEHIPRAVDTDSDKIHEKILKEKKEPIPIEKTEQTTTKANLNVQSIIAEKDIPSVKIDESGQSGIANGGSYLIQSPSYITFTVLIASQSVDCYYYTATNSFEVDYQVLKGGEFDIALAVYDASMKRVAFQRPANDGNIKIVVPPEMLNKDYSICFDNYQSSRDTKKVFMMIDLANINTINSPEFAQLNKLDLMHTTLSNIYSLLIQMEHLQEKRRSIESIDRSIMERNYEYVTMWCIIQISVMLFVSIIQLILIRSLFDSKGGIGMIIWKKLHDLTGGRI